MKFIITGIEEGNLDNLSEDNLLDIEKDYVADTINSQDITNWDSAFSWGDHSQAGYLKSIPAHGHSWSEISDKPTLNISDWNTAYAWGDHSTEGYLKNVSWSEVDDKPSEFTPEEHNHSASDINSGTLSYNRLPFSSGNVTDWNTAFNWGNHSTEGYLKSGDLPTSDNYSHWRILTNSQGSHNVTSDDYLNFINEGNISIYRNAKGIYFNVPEESDPTVPSHVKNISQSNISNWNTAYGWGNHAGAGYLKSADLPALDNYGHWRILTNSQNPYSVGSDDYLNFIDEGNISISRTANGIYFNVPDFAWSNITDKPTEFNPAPHSHNYDKYSHWRLLFNGESSLNVGSDDYVNFVGSGGTTISRNGNAVVISSETDNADVFVSSMNFDTSNGLLSLGRSEGASNITEDLDGRYALENHSHNNYDNYGHWRILTNSQGSFNIGSDEYLNFIEQGNISISRTANGIYFNVPDFDWSNISNKPTEFNPAPHTHSNYDNYRHWRLLVHGQDNLDVESDDYVNFIGQGGTTITRSGNAIYISSTSETADGNTYPNALDFNTGNGILSIGREGASTLTEDLDGRYLPFSGGTLDNGTSTDLTLESNDGGEASLNLQGDNQGIGRLYVGQNPSFGGGIMFRGSEGIDTTGAGNYHTTLYRRNDDEDDWTARNHVNSLSWEFRALPTVGGHTLATRDWVLEQGYGAGGSEGDGNTYPNSLNFDTSNGILSLGRQGASTLTEDLDGRYALIGEAGGDSYGHWRLLVHGQDNLNVESDDYVNFIGQGGTTITRSGNGIYISSETGGGTAFNGGTITNPLTISDDSTYPLILDSDGANQGAIGMEFKGSGSAGQNGYFVGNHLDSESKDAVYSFHVGSTESSTNFILDGVGSFYAGDEKVATQAWVLSQGFGSGSGGSDGNNYHTSMNFSSSNGVLSLTSSNGAPSLSEDLDVRYVPKTGGTFSGNISAPDFVGSSDIRLKEGIAPLKLQEIKSQYKTFNFIGKKQIRVGVIAQELEQEHPEFVRTDEAGYKAVSYSDLHSAEIAYLKDKVQSQEERIQKLEALVNKLIE